MEVLIQKTLHGHKDLPSQVRRMMEAHLQKLIKCRVPAAAALKRTEISLTLTDDKAIQKLNRKWRGKNASTDVLSFPLYGEVELRRNSEFWLKSSESWSLGDVVVSVDTAKRQALEKKWTLQKEINLLLAHGLLHLLGFDHEQNSKEASRMARMERILVGERRW